MNNDYVAEILRATGVLQQGDPAGVSAIIQNALAAAGLTGSSGLGAHEAPERTSRSREAADAQLIEGTLVPDDIVPADALWPKRLATRRARKPLGEVLQTLAAARGGLGLEGMAPGLGRPVGAPEAPLPEGAEFRNLHYSCAAGARRYRLYVPASAGEGLQGLVVMLHGCTQNPEDFAAGTGMNALAEEHRLLVVYPAQTNGDNSMSCWNWFRPGDQTRDIGEPAILAGLTRSVRDEFEVPDDRVFVAGLSAGGAMAAIMAETYPELYAAVGVHSGLAYGSANDVISAFGAMRGQPGSEPLPVRAPAAEAGSRPRAIVFHGRADTTVNPANADRLVASFGGDPARMTRSEHAGSGQTRGYSRSVTQGKGDAPEIECWMVDGAQHAWSGGHPSGSYTDPLGPNASAEMVRFFLQNRSGEIPRH